MSDRSVYLTVQEVAERMRCEHRTSAERYAPVSSRPR
jgi:hypothetical protein